MLNTCKSKNKHLVLHIGMGKCGSSSIQSFFYEWNVALEKTGQSINYLTHPGSSIDDPVALNSIVADYLDYSKRPAYINEVLEKYPLRTSVTQYLVREVQRTRSDLVIVSAEFVAWHLGDQEAELFLKTLRSGLPELKISVVCYFRQPATSNFLSVLQEDAKYNSEIKLYIPAFPYSENANTYKRWEALCNKYDLFWKPRVFNRRLLLNGNIIDDFLVAAGIEIRNIGGLISTKYEVNRSIDPVALSSIRRALGSAMDDLPFARRAEITAKLASIAARYLEENTCFSTKWFFKPSLADYITNISREESNLVFENAANYIDHQGQASLLPKVSLGECLPPGVVQKNGYLTGNLESFLEGIDEALVDDLARYLKVVILEMASYWPNENPLTSLNYLRRNRDLIPQSSTINPPNS